MTLNIEKLFWIFLEPQYTYTMSRLIGQLFQVNLRYFPGVVKTTIKTISTGLKLLTGLSLAKVIIALKTHDEPINLFRKVSLFNQITDYQLQGHHNTFWCPRQSHIMVQSTFPRGILGISCWKF